MISQYAQFCREENVEPLGRSTLFKILEVREASQRKSLQLDSDIFITYFRPIFSLFSPIFSVFFQKYDYFITIYQIS